MAKGLILLLHGDASLFNKYNDWFNFTHPTGGDVWALKSKRALHIMPPPLKSLQAGHFYYESTGFDSCYHFFS